MRQIFWLVGHGAQLDALERKCPVHVYNKHGEPVCNSLQFNRVAGEVKTD